MRWSLNIERTNVLPENYADLHSTSIIHTERFPFQVGREIIGTTLTITSQIGVSITEILASFIKCLWGGGEGGTMIYF